MKNDGKTYIIMHYYATKCAEKTDLNVRSSRNPDSVLIYIFFSFCIRGCYDNPVRMALFIVLRIPKTGSRTCGYDLVRPGLRQKNLRFGYHEMTTDLKKNNFNIFSFSNFKKKISGD